MYLDPVRSAEARTGRFHTRGKYEDYRQTYAACKDLGGGAILSQIHELDYLYDLFGMPLRVCVMGGHLSSLEVDVEDVASLLMEFLVDGRQIPIHLHEDYIQRPPSRTCKVIGDEGTIELNFHTASVIAYDEEAREFESFSFTDAERNEMFIDELKHFMDCVMAGRSTMVPLEEGVKSLQIALAAKESLASGKVVELVWQEHHHIRSLH